MTHDDGELPDFDWSATEVPRERGVARKWVMGLAALAVLIGLGVAAFYAAADSVTRDPWTILFGPFVVLGAFL